MQKTNWRQLFLPFRPATPSAAEPVPLLRAVPANPPAPNSESALEAHRLRIAGYLTMRMPDPVELTFTENKSTMISFRKNRGCFYVRLHRMFRHADTSVLDHLMNFLLSKKKADSSAIDRFIASHRDEIQRTRKRRTSALVAEGRHFDLKEVLDRVVDRYFGGQINVRIGWGNAPRRQRRRRRCRSISRALATYSYEDRVIRVSPVLDAENVPSYVIDWIVYHEVLHHVLPVIQSGSKRLYHSARFRSLERGFEHFEMARDWEEKHIEQLLR